MARENVMSTPIFDQLLREMAQRTEPRATTPGASPSPASTPAPSAATPTPEPPAMGESEQLTPAPRRRHRAD
jgi:hypothetical protein